MLKASKHQHMDTNKLLNLVLKIVYPVLKTNSRLWSHVIVAYDSDVSRWVRVRRRVDDMGVFLQARNTTSRQNLVVLHHAQWFTAQRLYRQGLSETYHPMSLLTGFVWNISRNVSTDRVCLKHITQCLYWQGLSETHHPMSLLQGFVWNVSPNVSTARVCLKHITQRLYCKVLSETYHPTSLLQRDCLKHITNVSIARVCLKHITQCLN